MKLIDFYTDLFRLILKYRNNEEWVKTHEVFRWWCIFLTSLSLYLIFVIVLMFAIHIFPKIILYTDLIRTIKCMLSFLILSTLSVLSFFYYKTLLLTGKELNFKNILMLFFYLTISFGFFYWNLYFLDPENFKVVNPSMIPDKIIVIVHRTYIMLMDFIIYSSLMTFSQNYYKISSNSNLVSIVNSLQIWNGILIVAVFISTFVQTLISSQKNTKT